MTHENASSRLKAGWQDWEEKTGEGTIEGLAIETVPRRHD